MEGRDELARRAVKPKHKMWEDNKFYDEVVLSTEMYTRNLPASIEAAFYLFGMDCGDAHDGPKCEDYARAAHAQIVSHFGLTDEQLPLLQLDLWNWNQPFAPAPKERVR